MIDSNNKIELCLHGEKLWQLTIPAPAVAEHFQKAYFMAHIFPFMNARNVINFIAMTAVVPMAQNVPVVVPGIGLERGRLWQDKFFHQ